MQKLMKHLHKSEKGFTLVELMVVVVIIGILIAIAIPIFNAVTARAERSACFANLRTIEGMKSQFQMMTDAERLAATWAGMFEDGVPVCPIASNAAYTNSTTGLETGRASCGDGTLTTHGTY